MFNRKLGDLEILRGCFLKRRLNILGDVEVTNSSGRAFQTRATRGVKNVTDIGFSKRNFFVKLSLLCNEMKYFILDSFEFKIDFYSNCSLHFNITGQCIAMSYPSVPTIMLQTKIVIINLFHMHVW